MKVEEGVSKLKAEQLLDQQGVYTLCILQESYRRYVGKY